MHFLSEENEYPTQAKARLKEAGLIGVYNDHMAYMKAKGTEPDVAFRTIMKLDRLSKAATKAIIDARNSDDGGEVDQKKGKPKKKSKKKVDTSGITSEDCEWVAANIHNNVAIFKDAPSRSAWGLLQEARDPKSGMYKWTLDHLAPKTFVVERTDKWERDPARNLINIEEQILAEAQADN